ncbi:Nn.00g002990.m01.CDS01 [Neocucurbitaria sp. VM-36]
MSKLASPLDEVLQNPVAPQARSDVIHLLWRQQSTAPLRTDDCDWDAYFAYYTKECNAALNNGGIYLSARSHHDLSKIAHLLEDEPCEAEVRQKLRQTFTQQRSLADEKDMLDGSIRLAARLLAMIHIGPLPSEVSARLFVPWNQGSLQHAVHSYFSLPPEIDSDSEHDVIGMDLTCRNIDRISGIEIVPTDNLVDHLRLVDKDKKLCVFHHVSFLRIMKATKNPIFPVGFIDETMDTLTLLFPDTDRKAKRWLECDFQVHPLLTHMDRGLLRCGHFRAGHPSRRLERFQFWRDRLGMLREAVDEATPPSKALLRALRDRKKGDRWLNSWVAIVAIGLTLFFGLVQSIEGAIQVFKAYH